MGPVGTWANIFERYQSDIVSGSKFLPRSFWKSINLCLLFRLGEKKRHTLKYAPTHFNAIKWKVAPCVNIPCEGFEKKCENYEITFHVEKNVVTESPKKRMCIRVMDITAEKKTETQNISLSNISDCKNYYCSAASIASSAVAEDAYKKRNGEAVG